MGMEFGFDNCAKACFLRGSLQKTTTINLVIDTIIRELDTGETYKYLGVNLGNGINHSDLKEEISNEYCRRIRIIFKTASSTQKIALQQ